ncbi:MAG: type VI secretion system baseplate subunit TssF [bacterium]|nr:type VI secretion system baseplate subunit TssF [bacterium]
MDPRLLRFYKSELEHLRESAAEFAGEYPKIAGRLGLSGVEVADPYVERLLEGFAFLTARVQLELDQEFPKFSSALLESLFPDYLAPIPSMGIAELQPIAVDPALAAGVEVPRGTELKGHRGKGGQTACTYRTARPVTLWPVRIADAQYIGSPRDLVAFGLPERSDVVAAIRLRLECTGKVPFGKLGRGERPFDSLPVFLQGAEDVPLELHEQLLGNSIGVVVRPVGGGDWHNELSAESVTPIGFARDEALLPNCLRSFDGHRLLLEYFAFPERFRGVEFHGLAPAFSRAGELRELEIFVLLDRSDEGLENNVDESRFALFCTPIVNLLRRTCDRIHLDPRTLQYHVVPDRTRPLDFEIHSVLGVTGHGTAAADEQVFRPLYGTADTAVPGLDQRFFALERRPRVLPAENRELPRSSYIGGEVFLSVSDAEHAPYDPELVQLSVEVLCTNRDLPLEMPIGIGASDFTLEHAAPVESVRCLVGPTRPKPTIAHGDVAWRLIDQLSLNHVSLLGDDPDRGAATLRELLALHGDLRDPHVRKQAHGVRSVRCEPVVRRLPTAGPLAFGRGLGISLELEESHFEGGSPFLFGMVLERFFARYVSLNSFTETALSTIERGEIAKWPPRIGNRQLL